jgi:hypothetical protein
VTGAPPAFVTMTDTWSSAKIGMPFGPIWAGMVYAQLTLTSRPELRWVTICHPNETTPVNAPTIPVAGPDYRQRLYAHFYLLLPRSSGIRLWFAQNSTGTI